MLCALAVVLSAGRSVAASYNEAISGDISGNRLAPTVIMLDPGTNLVQGSFGISPVPNAADLDYFTVVVQNGYKLDAVTAVTIVPGGNSVFLGVQVGPVMTMPSTSIDPSPLLGWAHVFPSQVGTNVLPAMNIAGPLAAGSYTFWSNETNRFGNWSYGYDFQVSAVPEPQTGLMLVAGLGLLIGAAVRRKQNAVR